MNVSKGVWVKCVRRCGFAVGIVALVMSTGFASAAEDAVVNATGANDQLTLQLEAGNPSRLEVRVGSVVVFNETVANLSSVTINGLNGDDKLIVDYSNGFLTVPTTFHGGFQTTPTGDSLEINGSVPGVGTSSYLPGPPSVEGKSGTITNSTGASSHVIRFSGLEPITLVGAGGSLTVIPVAATTTLTLSDDPANMAGLGGNVLTGDGGMETVYFGGFSSFIVYGGVGSETMTVTDVDPAPSAGGVPLTSVTIDGGNGGGSTDVSSDTINLQSLPVSITANLRGDAGNDIINLGSSSSQLGGILGQLIADGGTYTPGGSYLSSVTANGLTVSLNVPIGDRLYVDDDGTIASAQYNLGSTIFNRDTTVASTTFTNFQEFWLRAGQGANDINIIDTAPMFIPIVSGDGADDYDVTTTGASSRLVIQPVGGVDSVDIATLGDGSIVSVFAGDNVDVTTTGAACGLYVQGSNDNDTVTFRNTGAGSAVRSRGYGGNDRFIVERSAAASEIELHGDDNDDVFAVGVPGLDGLLGGFSADGGTGADSLTFDDSTDSSNNSYDVFDASLVRTGSSSLAFGAVETLSLYCGTGQDDVLVDLDNPPSAVSTFYLDAGDETGTDGDMVTAFGTAAIDMQLLGGDPTSAPGDSLVYTAPVNFFAEFETLETSALVVSPTSVQFTGLVPGSSMACETIEVRNDGSIPFDWSATGCDASPFSLNPATPGGTIDPGATQTFDVCLDASTITEPTIVSCTIDFTSDDPNLTDLDIPVFANLGVAIPDLGPLGMLLFGLLLAAGALYALRM